MVGEAVEGFGAVFVDKEGHAVRSREYHASGGLSTVKTDSRALKNGMQPRFARSTAPEDA